MREYANKPGSQSRTLDNNPKASRQAPMDVILQRYKERNIQRYISEEEEEPLQGKFGTVQRDEIDEDELLQEKFDASTAQREEIPSKSGKANLTGMPDNLKNGIESLSDYSMDDVRVYYNSSKPAQLQALAYTQGTDIHIAPGQEQYLPHEAWHVVQQKQGRVQPTTQLRGVNVNDDEKLEKEADVMGRSYTTIVQKKRINTPKHFTKVTQLAGHGNVHVIGDNWVAKLTTAREANAYRFLQQANNNQQGNENDPNILGLIPGVLQILGNHEGLNGNTLNTLGVQNPPWLTNWQANMDEDQQIIIMQNNITGERDAGYVPQHHGLPQDPKTFDIKIGYTTVSQKELTQRGHPHPTHKKNKLRIADFFTGSQSHGYRFCDGSPTELRDRLPAGNDRQPCITHICNQLRDIKQYINDHSITFVAASVLITIRNDGVIVKLIDLDHPMIDRQDGQVGEDFDALKFDHAKFEKYRDNFVNGIDSLIQMIDGFGNGQQQHG